jgi:hypothetical protein
MSEDRKQYGNNKQNSTLKKAMIEALEKSLGIVTTACKIVGIDRGSHYNWMKADKEYEERVKEIENIAIDFAESKLHKQIEKGDTTATIFYLKTKAKNRGYVERQEIAHDLPNANINIQIIGEDPEVHE